MAKLSRDDVLKLASLARLKLSDDELEHFAEELSEILGYVEKLNDADTEGLEPTHQVSGRTNVMRPDVIKDYGYEPLDLLKNVPQVQDNQIKTNRMIT